MSKMPSRKEPYTLGDMMRIMRASGRMRLRELEELSGVSIGNLARMEKDLVTPRVITLVKALYPLGLNLLDVVQETIEHEFDGRWSTPRLSPFRTMKPEELAPLVSMNPPDYTQSYVPLGLPRPMELMDTLQETYEGGGLITFSDLSAFIVAAMSAKGLTPWELSKRVKIDHRAILALVERKTSEHLEWGFLVRLDKALEVRGGIIALGWAAAEFSAGVFLRGKGGAISLWDDPVHRRNLEQVLIGSRLRALVLDRNYGRVRTLMFGRKGGVLDMELIGLAVRPVWSDQFGVISSEPELEQYREILRCRSEVTGEQIQAALEAWFHPRSK